MVQYDTARYGMVLSYSKIRILGYERIWNIQYSTIKYVKIRYNNMI